MNYLILIPVCLWALFLSFIGVAAAERREWRVFWMAFGLLLGTLLVIIAIDVMSRPA